MAKEEICVICEGLFNPGTLDEKGKCKVCAVEHPNAKNRDEALRQSTSSKEQVLTLTEARVREIVKEEFKKYRREIEGIKMTEITGGSFDAGNNDTNSVSMKPIVTYDKKEKKE